MNSNQKLKDLFESFLAIASPQEISVLARLFNRLTNDSFYLYFVTEPNSIIEEINTIIRFPYSIRWDSINESIETGDDGNMNDLVYEDIVAQYNDLLETIVERLS